MTARITFIIQPNEKCNEIKEVFKSDFEYEIIDNILHHYQGLEAYALEKKCNEAVANKTSCPIVVDITSVCFNALDGLPGTLITSLVNKLTSEELYRLLEGWDDKSAYVMYSLGLLEDADSEVRIFQGCLSGVMVKPKNPISYGWEACFQPDGYNKPYAELPQNVQIDISERRKALRTLKTYLIAKEFF